MWEFRPWHTWILSRWNGVYSNEIKIDISESEDNSYSFVSSKFDCNNFTLRIQDYPEIPGGWDWIP